MWSFGVFYSSLFQYRIQELWWLNWWTIQKVLGTEESKEVVTIEMIVDIVSPERRTNMSNNNTATHMKDLLTIYKKI